MNVQEVEARMVARITGLEEEESRLQEWLECLRKLDGIAAQWQMKHTEEPVIETQPVQVRELVELVEAIPNIETGQESLGKLHEECHVDENPSQTDNDPFDELRRKLSGESERKSPPVFNSGPLFGANA